MGILPIRELARILRATLSGDSGLTPPRLTGPKGFCAQDARALLFRGPHGLAAAADEKARRVGAMDRADSAVAQDVQ